MNDSSNYKLDYESPVDEQLQSALKGVDARLRSKHGMGPENTAVGVLDLRALRLAMVHPDRLEYAASLPKIGILLAWFRLRPELASHMDLRMRHELGLMIKSSSNEMATKFSRELGLQQIQDVLNSYGFYDETRGGGIWMGKHYGADDERIGDPVGGHSHAATVRQLLRFYLLLEQSKLVSPLASQLMKEIFDSPDIPHDNTKFVAGLAGRNVRIRRKWGSWENWLHDTAVVTGIREHYIIVGLIHHPNGDAYLCDVGKAIHDLMAPAEPGAHGHR